MKLLKIYSGYNMDLEKIINLTQMVYFGYSVHWNDSKGGRIRAYFNMTNGEEIELFSDFYETTDEGFADTDFVDRLEKAVTSPESAIEFYY